MFHVKHLRGLMSVVLDMSRVGDSIRRGDDSWKLRVAGGKVMQRWTWGVSRETFFDVFIVFIESVSVKNHRT